ncbi:MAG TPA: class I SAM-dependent methyltransferase [Gammaproteobacteria bacterium]|nr:class I SAM-dependent methyltransferase [Gammaproteobacteria bacterium]
MNTISNTAFYCCGVRMEDAERLFSICHDIYARRFMDEKALQVFEPFRAEKMPNISNIVRCRIIDDFIAAELHKDSTTTIITIGAGFDTRPYRLEDGYWIEIDDPHIIDYKNSRLPIAECKNPLQRRSIDFASGSLTEKLQDIDNSRPIVIVIEGVFMYLEPGAITTTLEALQQQFPVHILLCDLMKKRFFDKYAQSIHSRLSAIGGRFTGLSDNPERLFIDNNYNLTAHVPMFRRATELGLLWKIMKIPALVSALLLGVLMRDLNDYAVYRFHYG